MKLFALNRAHILCFKCIQTHIIHLVRVWMQELNIKVSVYLIINHIQCVCVSVSVYSVVIKNFTMWFLLCVDADVGAVTIAVAGTIAVRSLSISTHMFKFGFHGAN